MRGFWGSIVLGLAFFSILLIPAHTYAQSEKIRIFINGQEIRPDVQPVMLNDRVMVPARFIAEPLGATVKWNEEEQAMLISRRNVESKKSTSQTAKPFKPTDIFVFDQPDWNNLEVPLKTHASVVGSAHQAIQGRQEAFLQESDYLSMITSIAH